MNRTYIRQIAMLGFACLSMMTQAIDNNHFYRASNFFPIFHEPRLAREWLGSLDIFVEGGSTSTSKAGGCTNAFICHPCTGLLDTCGFYNMKNLGLDLPNQDLSNPVYLVLNNLAQLPDRDYFGQLSYSGQFSIFETDLFITQNFNRGLFIQFHMPFRKLDISCVKHTDLSPTDNQYPNINTPEWQAFLNLYPTILSEFNLSAGSTRSNGAGDTTVLLGWTCNYENTEILDFVDVSLRLGILFPTGTIANPAQAFSLPTGYNGHLGIPITFDMALGTYDWLSVGLHLGVLSFIDKTSTIRVKTSNQQQGLIKLQTVTAPIAQGLLWDAVGYIKADHVCAGLSALFGFTYTNKEPSFIKLDERDCCPAQVIDPCFTLNSCIDACDLTYGSWKMGTLHFMAEYDFYRTCPESVTPRLGVFYNLPVGGKRIFMTGIGGGSAGIDIALSF